MHQIQQKQHLWKRGVILSGLMNGERKQYQYSHFQHQCQLVLNHQHHQGSIYEHFHTGNYLDFILTTTHYKLQTWDPGGFFKFSNFILGHKFSYLGNERQPQIICNKWRSHKISIIQGASPQTNQPKGSCTIHTIHDLNKRSTHDDENCCLANMFCVQALIGLSSGKWIKSWQKSSNSRGITWKTCNYHVKMCLDDVLPTG